MTILVTGGNGQLGNEMRIVSQGSVDKYIFTDVVDASEESIAMLRKLAGSGEVSTYLKESSGGPPRKYYSLTDKGRERLENDIEEWKEFTAMVSGIIGGEQ